MTGTFHAVIGPLSQRLDGVNEQAIGRDGDDLEFRVSMADPDAADVCFRINGMWVARVPGDAATLEVLEAIASAVRNGRALGRVDGKREIGLYLRQECGL